MATKIRPIDARVLVKEVKRQQQTQSGIILPDGVEDKPIIEGEVVAVGPGSRNMMDGSLMPMDIKVGDVVIYTRFGGHEFDLDNEKVIVLMEKDIIAVIEK
jgi:chaperonin GroES